MGRFNIENGPANIQTSLTTNVSVDQLVLYIYIYIYIFIYLFIIKLQLGFSPVAVVQQ
jgi:hypothetical protein